MNKKEWDKIKSEKMIGRIKKPGTEFMRLKSLIIKYSKGEKILLFLIKCFKITLDN